MLFTNVGLLIIRTIVMRRASDFTDYPSVFEVRLRRDNNAPSEEVMISNISGYTPCHYCSDFFRGSPTYKRKVPRNSVLFSNSSSPNNERKYSARCHSHVPHNPVTVNITALIH